MELLIFEKIILSLAIGALIGVEREWRAKKSSGVFAGVRTFMLVCLIGVLSCYISQLLFSLWPVYIVLAGIVGSMLIGYYLNYKRTKSIGLTTELAFFLTYIIGILLFFESYPYFLPISLGVILALILFFREPLHRFAQKRTKKEVRDAFIFAALVFIVLPILPNYAIDPYGALNPYFVWFSMVLVMTVSFAGYVAMKLLGKRGLGLTGFFGGLASSTSVTISMSALAKRSKTAVKSAVFAIIVASSTMFLRMIFVSMFFNSQIAFKLVPALGALGIAGYLLSYISWKKLSKSKTQIKLSSPISFKSVFQFMAIFIIVLFATQIAKLYFPSAIYVVAALSGIFDVDAITISLASLSSGLPVSVAVNGIIIAAISNTISKAVLARVIGGKNIGKEVKRVFLPLVLAGIVVAALAFFI